MVQVDQLMAEREYLKQILRFGNKGVNLSIPPELVPADQYVRFDEIVTNRDGTIQAGAGGTLLFTITNLHSLRRYSRYRDGTTFYIGGFGTGLASIVIPGYGTAGIAGVFSGNPLTMLEAGTAINSEPFLYIGDAARNVKVDGVQVATKMGLLRPIPANGQPAVVATSAGAGNLTGDYDWRYTYYRSDTGAESNPSDVQTTLLTLAAESANVPVVASTDAQVTNIRIYRRGGTLPDDWRRVTETTNTTATYVDNNSDVDIASATVIALDNDVPVTSVDASGTTLIDASAVPLPYIWGPVENTLFGTGDPNRSDTVYFSKRGFPESWPAENTVPVDSPSDKPVNGFVYDGKSYVFTRDNLYQMVPNLITGNSWTPIKTPCGHGIVGPFAFCVGTRIWFCSKDGVYETTGEGEATRISDAIRPMFPYRAQEGYPIPQTTYYPVNFGFGIADLLTLRMTYHNNEVWLFYIDIYGNRQTWVYQIETQSWRYITINEFLFAYSDEANQSNLLQIDLAGKVIQSAAGDRDGDNLQCVFMTGGHDQGFPRADKEYGDGAIWMDCAGNTVTVSAYINSVFTVAAATATLTGSGLQKYILPLAGLYGRHIAFQISWLQGDAGSGSLFYWVELAYLPHPEEIKQRATDWDDLGHAADKLVKGMLITADTRGNPIELQVLYDGSNVGATFTIGPDTAGKPRVYNVGFPSFRGRKVRLQAISTAEWKFYGIEKWLFDAEPECLTWHEVYWGDAGHPHDKLIKGITIEADCGGVERTLRVFDDTGTLQETITIGPGVAGIPAIYELSWSSFRSRNVRLLEGV
jgi:hypothetical protein